jgi:hypothetical protein
MKDQVAKVALLVGLLAAPRSVRKARIGLVTMKIGGQDGGAKQRRITVKTLGGVDSALQTRYTNRAMLIES